MLSYEPIRNSINTNINIINTQADANEEAEMIIRAIMQVFLYIFFNYMFLINTLFFKDEVDNSVYSKMADDLEAASKRVKKRKVKKVKESASEISA